MTEPQAIRRLFRDLVEAPLKPFPAIGPLICPAERGVYVIYNPNGEVAHVGCTPKGRKGLQQRLRNHLAGQSSFTKRQFDGAGKTLRNGYSYRFVVIESGRYRALLEAYAIGHLCPIHLGAR